MLPIILAIKDENERNYVAEIYETHKKSLYLTANNILHHDADSWNCVQDVVVELIDHFEAFANMSEIHKINYLHLCCKCIAINYYNEKKRQNWHEISARVCEEEKDFDIPDPFVDVTREYASKETLDRVLRIVEAMGEEYVQTLYFKYVYHYTDQHSATMLGVSVSNFRVRLTRIRKRLKMHFGKEIQI